MGQKRKVTVSPSAAVIVSGLKTSSPVLVPTATLWSTASAEPARAVAAKSVERCIVIGREGKILACLDIDSECGCRNVEIMM